MINHKLQQQKRQTRVDDFLSALSRNSH